MKKWVSLPLCFHQSAGVSNKTKEKEESHRAIYRKIWTAPIDLFLHLTTMKMKVQNDTGRLVNYGLKGV
jgi:hypothetical protein